MHIREVASKDNVWTFSPYFHCCGPVVKSELCVDGVKERQTIQSLSQ